MMEKKKMKDQAWKNFERRVAKVTGGERIPIIGRQQLDIRHPYLGIECKHRKSIPKWLFTDAWNQAVQGSKENNIIWTGPGRHNFSVFLDQRPGCPDDERPFSRRRRLRS